MYSLNKNLISIGAIIVSVIIVFVFVRPQYSEISELRIKQQEYKKYLDDANDVRIIRGRLLATRDSVAEDNWKKLKLIVPDSIDKTELLLRIDDMVSLYGIEMSSFDAEDVAEVPTVPANLGFPAEMDNSGSGMIDQGVVGQADSLLSQDYSVLKFDIALNASYRNFLGFLQEIERNVRLYDLVGLTISSGGDEENKIYKVQVSLKNYQLK